MKNEVIGKYRVLRLIGKGGMASVYEAEHELLRNLVLEARAGFARIDTVGQIETSADEYNLMVGATWKLDRNFRVFARADRRLAELL